ncbi:MAG TPA: hypothetical protein VGC99_13800 [Candidatus Tectomicrobia bacterium]
MTTGHAYTDEIAALIDLEAARAYMRAGENAAARMAAERAASRELTLELAVECIEDGADPATLRTYEQDLSALAAQLNVDAYTTEPFFVTCWLAATRLLSWTNPAALESAPPIIIGVGWYREWLRFAIRLALAESRRRAVVAGQGEDEAEALLLTALEDLARDIRPFEGSPRTCDLFQIHDHVSSTIARVLALLCSREAWERAVPLLRTIAYETTIRLDRHHSGPLTPTTLVELLLPYAQQPELQVWLIACIEEPTEAWQEKGQYYESHAQNELLRVRALLAVEQRKAAQKAWHRAAMYLSAYGYHKDSALYDLIEPLPLLARYDTTRAKELCAHIQRLPFLIAMHTDGRSTNQMPLDWFQSLLQVDFVGAIHLLANTLRQNGGQFGWLLDTALRAAIYEARRHPHANPLIVAFLDATRPFPSLSRDDAEDTRQEAKCRMPTLERLLADDKKVDEQGTTTEQKRWGHRCLVNFLAQVEGDGPTYLEDIVEIVCQCAQRWDVVLPPRTELAGASDSARGEEHRPISSNAPSQRRLCFDWPLFAPDATPLALLARLRDLDSFGSNDVPDALTRFVNAFGYRLAALIEAGDEDEALRLLRYFAHDSFCSEAAIPLAELGEGLERHGQRRAASVAFALAYTRSHGGYGDDALGGSDFQAWLLRALELERDTAFEVLFDEVQGYAERGRLNGLVRNLIDCCARHFDMETAFASWDEACRMLELRLPDTGSLYWTFSPYRPADVPRWSADEALAYLLLARLSHPEFTRRTAALVGLRAMLETLPNILMEPLHAALRSDITQTTEMSVLQTLWHTEPAPYEVTCGLKEELTALLDVPHFGLRATARQLLQRAGITVMSQGSSTRRTFLVPANAVLNPGEALSLDWGERIERLAQLWPTFPLLVELRFKAVWDNVPAHKEKTSALLSAAKSDVEQAIPATTCFWWHREIFEGAFHEALDGIEPQLWRQGQWTPDMGEFLLRLTTPSVRLHVARWHSRIPPPPLPLPMASLPIQPAHDLAGKVLPPADVPPLPPPSFHLPETIQEDSPFDGWVRLALFDEEIVNRTGAMMPWDVDHKIRIVEGTVLLSGAEYELQAGDFPYSKGFPLDWCGESEEMVLGNGHLSRSTQGPIVTFAMLDDPIGVGPLFSLAPHIAAWLGLSPGRWTQMLHLVDETNKIALVFRHWSLRPIGSGMDEQTPRFHGCDLLLRPNLFARLRAFFRHPLVVWRDYQQSPLS